MRNNSKKTSFTLKDNIPLVIQISVSLLVGFASIVVMGKTNTIANAANMLQINNAIQLRTDLVLSLEKEQNELIRSMVKQGVFDENEAKIGKSLEIAVCSLLNAYELACTFYLENKIDKNTFRLYYGEILKDIVVKYDYAIKKDDYSEIKKVYKEWQKN
jgi:hypothetical protein